MNYQEQKNSEQLELKQKAKISLEKGKEIILQNIPNDEIVSIYVKGTYVQDELLPESDVDIIVILKTEKYLLDIYKLTKDFGYSVNPPFQAMAYTLDEIKTGKRASNRINSGTPVSSFVKYIDELPLIYGKKPEGQLFTRTDLKDLEGQISAYRKLFLPGFNDGTIKFQEIVKHVFWLTEKELRVLGHKPYYS